MRLVRKFIRVFQSTLPAKGATFVCVIGGLKDLFQSTLPAKGATMGCCNWCCSFRFQSTLPAKGATLENASRKQGQVSIHAPREGSDFSRKIDRSGRRDSFNPRSPRRERLAVTFEESGRYVSIHAPREGSDLIVISTSIYKPVSIHAPREGSDMTRMIPACRKCRFQSTLPAKGATISIRGRLRPGSCFNPRSPRRERRWICKPGM